MSFNKYINVMVIFIMASILMVSGCSKEKTTADDEKGRILYYTDAMHPDVKVSPEEYEKGTTQCPICNMDLNPVYEEKTAKEPMQMDTTVKLSNREKLLVGVKTFAADYHHLSREIVTVGKIAYDPGLVVAEKEYITALESFEKLSASNIAGSKNRAKRLLDETAYKLKLLGLNNSMINELKETKKVHNNLILPEEKVWVYADIYEFEIGLVKVGQKMKVEATAFPGEYFTGRIKAVDSVLNPKTRSVRIRAEVLNTGMRLKPHMYLKVIISSHLGNVLAVPRDSVLDTGLRKVVYVDMGDGKYLMKEIKTGHAGVAVINDIRHRLVHVKKGVQKGDMVVTKANFLIDSQSQLSGPASAAYGGALDSSDDAKEKPGGHQH